MKYIVTTIVISLISILVLGQPSANRTDQTPPESVKKGSMKGVIIEAGSKIPLEYANIAIYSTKDSSLAGGGIADSKGFFVVPDLNPGNYFIDTKFIGYEHTRRNNLRINPKNLDLDLGIIELIPASKNLESVEVIAQDRPILYEIDKKIIDPSQFPTAANGTATDILANTPSVVVDIEGNVTLRGSSSFTVLIDGRPTPFDPADALDQIPASTIRNIEIITNPSAKYDPDGNAGIININTKKSKLIGLSGIVNATADTYGSLTGDFLLNYKMEKFNVYISGNKANRYGKGLSTRLNETYGSDTIITSSTGTSERGHNSWSVKSGLEYYMNDKNTMVFNVSVNGRDRVHGGISDFHQYSTAGVDIFSTTESNSIGASTTLAFSFDYKKKFDKEGQELTLYANYESGVSNELSLYDQFDVNKILFNGQKSWEDGDENNFLFKADYVHPITEKMKFEMGYEARIDREFEWNDVHWYSTDDNYTPSINSDYYSDTYFNRNIHSMYSTFSNSGKVFGYQLGLRAENTNRSLTFSESVEPFTINRWDFYPTAHLSVQLPSKQQLTTSYTRRIERPRGYYLEPFKTYEDAYNIRVGNPNITPEYIDSYELGYQVPVGKGFFSAELYHRKTNDKIERVKSVYKDDIILQSVDNIGADYSTGMELMLNLRLAEWWMLNLMGNTYNYRIEGVANGRDISEQSNNWNSRFSSIFNLTKTTKFQIDGMYNSPTVSIQGSRDGFMYTNVAVRQDLLKNKLNVTFSVRDVLNTAKFGYESSGTDFYSRRDFDMKSPVFAFTVSYKINNYRQKREAGERGEGGEGIDMGGGEF